VAWRGTLLREVRGAHTRAPNARRTACAGLGADRGCVSETNRSNVRKYKAWEFIKAAWRGVLLRVVRGAHTRAPNARRTACAGLGADRSCVSETNRSNVRKYQAWELIKAAWRGVLLRVVQGTHPRSGCVHREGGAGAGVEARSNG
jgi:hypothetical protein